ncbi:hypothetical protein CON74_25620 [Bacillus thuringiensis]|uniref:DUF2290 domain-containing protein n=1 Tax=Bacillus thuringiensis TaxID=1428 RepID=UPI000BEE2893|nr:DUF2290 domain-containing protein [Bacillus thuringiensis]PEA58037.1 hypothetical protein CON74_25620 [Bacillus thuringiensis]HDR8143061.1 DUF2290 domain-containing protein [Bacillus cereus]
MNTSKIFIGYTQAKSLLSRAEIKLEEELSKAGSLRKSDLSLEFIKASYKYDDYRDLYKTARDNLDYNFLLNDGSIFQFGYETDPSENIVDLRYAFYEAPAIIIPYEEFLHEQGLDIQECGDAFFEEYTQYVSESDFKKHITNIRYDFSINQYSALIHPVSHIHIGQDNQIRLPVSFIMTPANFVAFIIRHIYWEKWIQALTDEKFKRLYLDCYKAEPKLTQKLHTVEEKFDIHFSYN